MPCKADIHIIKQTVTCHKHFTAAIFFTRTAKEINLCIDAFFFTILFQCNRRTQRTCTKAVVTAAVTCKTFWTTVCRHFFCYAFFLAEGVQSIVFSKDTDFWSFCAPFAYKCCRNTAYAHFCFKAKRICGFCQCIS